MTQGGNSVKSFHGVSKLANDAGKFYLCDHTGFETQTLFTDKAGNAIGLFYKSL